jgi:hypothetical protein
MRWGPRCRNRGRQRTLHPGHDGAWPSNADALGEAHATRGRHSESELVERGTLR